MTIIPASEHLRRELDGQEHSDPVLLAAYAKGTLAERDRLARDLADVQAEADALVDNLATARAERDQLADQLAVATRTVATDLIRYLPANDDAGRLALWCTDCAPDPTRDAPFWTEDDSAEQVTELCLANLVGIAEQHEQQHHDEPTAAHTHYGTGTHGGPAATACALCRRGIPADTTTGGTA